MSAAAEFDAEQAELARRLAWADFYAAHPEYLRPTPSPEQLAQCARREPRRFADEPVPLTDFSSFDGAPDEVWRVIPSATEYAVSTNGRVRREAPGQGTWAGRIMAPFVTNKGYLSVRLYVDGKHRTVHSLVAEAFIGPRPEGLLVLHNDGNRVNNAPSNLRYGTYADNVADAKTHGTVSSGPAHGALIRAGRYAAPTPEQVSRQAELNAAADARRRSDGTFGGVDGEHIAAAIFQTLGAAIRLYSAAVRRNDEADDQPVAA